MRNLFAFLFKKPGHNHRGRTVHMDCTGCGDALRQFVLLFVPKDESAKAASLLQDQGG